MAQFLRPTADQATGLWTNPPLWSKADTDDGTDAISDAVGNNADTSNADLVLGNGSDPQSSSGHIMRARWHHDQTGRSMQATAELFQGDPGAGGTLIATLQSAVDVGTTEVESTYTLTAGEADNITDYTDLYVRLRGRGTGGGPGRSLHVDLFEFEIPDAGAATARFETSWAELETPDSATRVEASWAELEVPESPTRIETSWAEFETPDIGRIEASWAEIEVPDTPTRLEVSWSEVEIPDPSGRIEVSWAEFESPDTDTRLETSWAELEIPSSTDEARLEVSWSELETPDTPSRIEGSWAEFEVPESPTHLEVSWTELETPDSPTRIEASWAEVETPESPVRLEASWAELETSDSATRIEVSWAELEAPLEFMDISRTRVRRDDMALIHEMWEMVHECIDLLEELKDHTHEADGSQSGTYFTSGPRTDPESTSGGNKTSSPVPKRMTY